MQRRIYRGVLKEEKEEILIEKLRLAKQKLKEVSDSGDIENPSLFRYDKHIFLYFEFATKEFFPEKNMKELSAYLEVWPSFDGYKIWTPMYDIFHYQAPQNNEEWRRKTKVIHPLGRIIRLKPEMIASYIFYHYQYQEEKPCDGDKYGIIGIHEDLLFFYCETPAIIEKPTYAGLLNTKNTPSNWSEIMSRHFLPWIDVRDSFEWREVTLI